MTIKILNRIDVIKDRNIMKSEAKNCAIAFIILAVVTVSFGLWYSGQVDKLMGM